MTQQFALSEEQKERRRLYHEIGWPNSLNKQDLIIFEMKSWETIEKYILSNTGAPSIPMGRGFLIPLSDWIAFKSAVAMHREYKGLVGDQYVVS
ncbi:hypothetical protein [Pediococcus pentosaceus]|uniref:hypothetical protein n=1 Tax=Pediococcus pentosaceus TaxID=1255 RepID=UPI003981990F